MEPTKIFIYPNDDGTFDLVVGGTRYCKCYVSNDGRVPYLDSIRQDRIEQFTCIVEYPDGTSKVD